MLIYTTSALNVFGMSAPDDPHEAEEWYHKMEIGVDKWATASSKEVQIENLGDYVFKFGQRMPNHPDPRWCETYRKAQSALLSIPGHAKYFADELERLRLDPKSDYERVRAWYLADRLRHLPSPETVQVLGHYLSDMRDIPIDENPKYNEAVRSGKIKPIDWNPTPQNAWLATYALSNIGLKDPPFEPVAEYEYIRLAPSEESLPRFRAWWEEVKSGRKSFSFKGRKEEYRFKPDGTWETIPIANPPDDAPKRKPHPATPGKPSPASPARPSPASPARPATPPSSTPLWPWLGGGILAVLSALAYFLKSRKTAGSPPMSTS